jgi:hypothetical protein
VDSSLFLIEVNAVSERRPATLALIVITKDDGGKIGS